MQQRGGGSRFPLKIHSSGRYFLDNYGQYFLIQGMALWEIEVNPTRAQVDQVLAGIAAQGYNAILFETAEHLFSFQATPYQNVEGNIPWTGMTGTTPPYSSVNFSALNEAYWQFVDLVIRRAWAFDMLCVITPAYYGFAGTQEGWGVGGELAADTQANRIAFGAALARRWGSYPNVMICLGGDNVLGASLYSDIMNGMRSVRTDQMVCGHAARSNDAFSAFSTVPGFNVNTQYSNNASNVADAAVCYGRSGPLPFFLIEDEYFNASGQSNQTQRCQKLQSMLSGSAGYFFGHDPLWSLGCDTDSGNQTANVAACLSSFLYTTPSQQMGKLSGIVKSVQRVEPVTSLVASPGSGASAICQALSVDGTQALIYFPAGGGASVALTPFSKGNLTADWGDPTNGAFTADSTGLANSSSHAFTAPSVNAGGDADFVLRIRAL